MAKTMTSASSRSRPYLLDVETLRLPRSWPPVPAQQKKHEYAPEGEGFAGSRPYGARRPRHAAFVYKRDRKDSCSLCSLHDEEVGASWPVGWLPV